MYFDTKPLSCTNILNNWPQSGYNPALENENADDKSDIQSMDLFYSHLVAINVTWTFIFFKLMLQNKRNKD